MIVSFHPLFEGDKYIICAGRDPNQKDLDAILAADAVLLPQGCRQSLYGMARKNCARVFPNYDTRFAYPGKIGQIRLFRETATPHPESRTYAALSDFDGEFPAFPFVFKFDWGGEGHNVFLIRSHEDFEGIMEKTARFEKTGQRGFLLQEYVPTQNRDLRVVVIGRHVTSYWRVQKDDGNFRSNLSEGGVTDADSDPDLQEQGIGLVKDFCEKTGINLAGFDLLFSSESKSFLFLEINYFFGRQGLGGSEKYYELLDAGIRDWLCS